MIGLNGRTVNVKLTRHELIDLMLSCTAVEFEHCDDQASKRNWRDLHDKLKSILDNFDSKQPEFQTA